MSSVVFFSDIKLVPEMKYSFTYIYIKQSMTGKQDATSNSACQRSHHRHQQGEIIECKL